MSEDEKQIMAGDKTWTMKNAYNQAVTEGMIDPKKVSLKDFWKMSDQEIFEDRVDDSPEGELEKDKQEYSFFASLIKKFRKNKK